MNAHGPAMHETLMLPNSLPSSASMDSVDFVAFQRPSGEHGSWPLHGTFPVLGAVNYLARLPTPIVDSFLYE